MEGTKNVPLEFFEKCYSDDPIEFLHNCLVNYGLSFVSDISHLNYTKGAEKLDHLEAS